VKQSGRNQIHTISYPPHPSLSISSTISTPGLRQSECLNLTTAMVSSDSLNAVSLKTSRDRSRVGGSNTSRRRAQRKKAREKSYRESILGSLSTLEHDSSDLMVVRGTVDGRLCRDVLVDPGASSNFVRRDWALSNRLPVQQLKLRFESDQIRTFPFPKCQLLHLKLPLFAKINTTFDPLNEHRS
jgi:hypothetical protein